MVDWIISDFMNISEADGVAVSFKLSAFHTCFNVCNVLILIWFVKLIEKAYSSKGTGRRVSPAIYYWWYVVDSRTFCFAGS